MSHREKPLTITYFFEKRRRLHRWCSAFFAVENLFPTVKPSREQNERLSKKGK